MRSRPRRTRILTPFSDRLTATRRSGPCVSTSPARSHAARFRRSPSICAAHTPGSGTASLDPETIAPGRRLGDHPGSSGAPADNRSAEPVRHARCDEEVIQLIRRWQGDGKPGERGRALADEGGDVVVAESGADGEGHESSLNYRRSLGVIVRPSGRAASEREKLRAPTPCMNAESRAALPGATTTCHERCETQKPHVQTVGFMAFNIQQFGRTPWL